MSTRLAQLAHRPWPIPNQPWVTRMRWEQLLFAHWPIRPEILIPTIPSGLELDLWEGMAWVAVVPFMMKDVSPRGVPHIPLLADFAEINVRTYVTAHGKPGVWFYSLDAASRLAVAIARRTFHLPYFNASIALKREAETTHYQSSRPGAQFMARYKPVSPVYHASPLSLEHWLTERYCLYAKKDDGTLLRGEIHHSPWPLQRAEAEIEINTMCSLAGFTLPPVQPLLHYAERLDVVAWWPTQTADL